jgi:hypothetical protein
MTSPEQTAPVRPRRKPAPAANGTHPPLEPTPPIEQLEPPELPPTEADRLAPSSIEAEQSVLGSILIDSSVLERVAPLITPASFYKADHGVIFGAMLALQKAGSAIDLVTLGDELRRTRKASQVGGSAYLAHLMNATPTAVNAEHYARIVAMKALARRAIADAGRIAAMGYEDANNPEELLERLKGTVESIASSWTGSAGSPIERLGARALHIIPTDPPPPMLLDRLDPTGHTILYGTGGVGKGTLSASWIVGMLNAEKRILIVDYENHPDEWARRIHGMGAADLMERVLHVAPLTAQWKGRRGAIWDQADDLRQLARQFEADHLVIDSIVPACGATDALKPEAASQYAGALEYIGTPALSLAHVTKADDLRYPFGSIFWHNLARTTWSLKADGATVILAHRKHNNYARVAPQKVEVTWDQQGVPVDLWEKSYSEDLTRRISAALVGDPLTVKQLVDRLDEENTDDDAEPTKADTVSKALRRGAKASPPKFVRDGDKWSNAA